MMEKETIKVTGAIIKKDGRYLIGRRGPNEKSPGLWEFPGGKFNKGENAEECIHRELKEELSIDAKIGDLFTTYVHDSADVIYDLYFFKIISYSGSLVKSAHDRLKWIKIEEFNDRDVLIKKEKLSYRSIQQELQRHLNPLLLSMEKENI